jgi:sigma-B regulation protein RsbU (phosphoserine phosphatase)
MPVLCELRTSAKIEHLHLFTAIINSVGEQLSLTEKTAFAIELAVDEAYTNICHHAYPSNDKGDVMLVIETTTSNLQVTLLDWGVPFNRSALPKYDKDTPVDQRAQGGMGVHLIEHLMDSAIWLPTDDTESPNMLIMTKHMDYLTGGAQRTSTRRQLNALLSVSQVMATTTDPDKLLDMIVEEVRGVLDAERSTLYLLDEANGELYSKILHDEKLGEIRLKIGDGVAGQVALTGGIINIENPDKDPRLNTSFTAQAGIVLRNMLTVPMVNHEQKVIGVIQAINKRGEPFTQRDERLLSAMASQAAIGIENARLLSQEIAQKLLNQELETARAIQRSFLPNQIPQLAGWQIATYWSPMSEVAGDFYDFIRTPDGRLAIVVADVSGKGVPAALFMALSVTVLRFALELNLSPKELLHRANMTMLTSQQSGMFTTAFVGYLDEKTGLLMYASAGHLPPIHYHHQTKKCTRLSIHGVALGVFPTATFAESITQVEQGDILAFYTDGITEAINDLGEEFGENLLIEIIQTLADETADTIVQAVKSAVILFATNQGTFDDETLIIVKRTPHPSE